MNTRILTEIICVVALLLLLAWDVVCMVSPLEGDTISEVIRSANHAMGGLVALVTAALWIHWFGPVIW